jgi:putative heme-binding domain-containing protein
MFQKSFAAFALGCASGFAAIVWPAASNAADDPRLKEVKVPQGFEKSIFAGPPNISYPTCIAAEPSGEVFVGVDQNGSLDTKPGRGMVVRCVDTNGDGVADSFKVFARMDSPRGLIFDHNTLYVMHPPVLEAFYDDDGDGVADRSEVLVRGLAHDLSFRGADHTCNGARMGIDGWLYIALGDYGAIKAVGKDGTELQLHGGGIVRVRPDGTELELVCRGTRNIYDVAIDPFMNLYTCDNTNDGDDWNVRLSHMMETANYGYPSYFRHFSDEMMPTMEDYGGGAPTGALFLDEPGFPNGLGYGLYACQWGWSSVTRHPLQPDGATFKSGKETFVELPRPTGIDADGAGHVYVASWKGATFTYAGPNVGYILRVTPPNAVSPIFPDLNKTDDAQLLKLLGSPSAVWRFHIQREILRRGDTPQRRKDFSKSLEQMARSNETPAVRVAAVYTLKQLLGPDAKDALLRISRDASLRGTALRALSDRKTEATSVSTKVFTDALNDRDPKVRREAVIALNRLGRVEAADRILPLTADPDVAISHVAFRAVLAMGAADVCFKALDQGNAAAVPGAMRVLRNLHEPKVVDGLIARVDKTETVSTRRLLLQALCRLCYREADWDGSWWGTRPDTSGPYFKPVTWEESGKIGQALATEMARADDETLGYLLEQCQLHKLEIPELEPALISAGQKPALRPKVVDALGRFNALTKDGVAFLKGVALADREDSALRLRAFGALARSSDQPDAAEAAVAVLVASGESGSSGSLAPRLREAFLRDGPRTRNVAYFTKLAASTVPAQREVAYAVLLEMADNANAPRNARNAARRAIDNGWTSSGAANLLHAIADTHATNYAGEVRARLNDPNAEVAAAAAYASAHLASGGPSVTGTDHRVTIAKMAYEEVLQTAIKSSGDAKLGEQLFKTIGCDKCHTTLKSEPLKGPFLGDIAVRYGRPEIIESILRPNAQIAQGFVTTWVETKDGSEYEGFISRESGDELEIRNIVGATVVPKKDIAKRGTRTTSTMPEGLLDQSTPDDLAALLAYLQSFKPK